MNFTSDIDATTYTTASAFVRTAILEKDPTAAVSPGTPVDGLVIQNQAYLAALHNSRLTQLQAASSLQAIVEGLADVTDTDVDNICSNYFITRNPAVAAYGKVKIVTSTDTSYVLPIGFEVSFSGLTFRTTAVHYIYASATTGVTTSDTVQLLRNRGDGTYEFFITVTAQQTGSASKLPNGAVVTLATTSSGMVSASVSGDFSGGTAAETNAELLARASTGVTAKVIGGDEHIDALVRAQYPTYQTSTVGVGSSLMTRDQNNIFGVSTGGKIDVYAKTAASMSSSTITITGTITNSTTRAISATIPYTTAAGIYRIVAIRPAGLGGTGGNTPATLTRNASVLSGWNPVLINSRDIAYSARQAITITWLDTLGSGTYTNGLTRSYDIDILYMPDLLALDTYLTNNVRRPGGTDLLVKAGVPCRTSVAITLATTVGYSAPSTTSVAVAIANTINAIPFGTASLTGYALASSVAAVAPYSTIQAVSVGGTIYRPNDTDLVIAPSSTLTITIDGTAKQGPSNTFFSSNIADISVTLI